MASQETDLLRKCPECELVYRPDPRVYKDPDEYCPRCGADLNQRPAWRGPENE